MYTRYYDGYTRRNVPESGNTEANETINTADVPVLQEPKAEIASLKNSFLPFDLSTDDIILIAVLFLVASESGDDFILPLILGYLLLGNR